ncbi:MAG: helix-turn-helix transcriptional regulator [Micromonosporaceae bacterium]
MAEVEAARTAQLAAVAALEEPTRRRVYEHVARQPVPVSREDVAEALGLARSTAAFHLDRLAGAGLLEVVYERRTGRSGPGAGRPSKLYHRSDVQVTVSLPERRYDLAGRLLAAAVDESARTGEPARRLLQRQARELGRELGRAGVDAAADDEAKAMAALEVYGFEPRPTGEAIVLGNCPFHALAAAHTDLVCGMNLCLLDGLLEGLAATGLGARLDPRPGRCCVRIEPDPDRAAASA